MIPPPDLEIGKVYEIDDDALVDSKREQSFTKEDRLVLAEIQGLRKDCEGENQVIALMQKLEKRQKGSTKVTLSKREEFCAKKYKKAITSMLDNVSKFFYKKYLQPTDENDKYSRKESRISKPDPTKLLSKDAPEVETEEEKLMRLLGLP